MSGRSDEAWNVQLVIDTLSAHVLHSDLSHITGERIVAKDKMSVRNLVEIFSGLMEILLEAAEGKFSDDVITKLIEVINCNYFPPTLYCLVAAGGHEGSPSPDDSNVLSSDAMSVVSSVLQQELGHSYRPEMVRGLRHAGERKRDVVDVTSETDSSSSKELARAGAVLVSHEVVAGKQQTSASSVSSSLSESEQEDRRAVAGHHVPRMPSVSSITSDLSENEVPSVRRSVGGVVRPVSSTPRKASRRVVVRENAEMSVKPRWERGEFTDKSTSSRNEQDTAELVNEALEVSDID